MVEKQKPVYWLTVHIVHLVVRMEYSNDIHNLIYYTRLTDRFVSELFTDDQNGQGINL